MGLLLQGGEKPIRSSCEVFFAIIDLTLCLILLPSV